MSEGRGIRERRELLVEMERAKVTHGSMSEGRHLEDSTTQNEAYNLWGLRKIDEISLLRKMSLVIWFGGGRESMFFKKWCSFAYRVSILSFT